MDRKHRRKQNEDGWRARPDDKRPSQKGHTAQQFDRNGQVCRKMWQWYVQSLQYSGKSIRPLGDLGPAMLDKACTNDDAKR